MIAVLGLWGQVCLAWTTAQSYQLPPTTLARITAHPPTSYWYSFDVDGRKWGLKNAPSRVMVSFVAQDLPQLLDACREIDWQQSASLGIFLKNTVSMDPYEISDQLEQDYGLILDPPAMAWLEQYGPQALEPLLAMLTADYRLLSFGSASLEPFVVPFGRPNWRWILGSVPPKLNPDPREEPKPMLTRVTWLFGHYLTAFATLVLPFIVLGTVWGFFLGLGPAYLWRAMPVAGLIHFVAKTLEDTIGALPRLLMIILLIVLFREPNEVIQVWMIALPVGLTAFVTVSRRCLEALDPTRGQDMLAMRHSQGFSMVAVAWERFCHRIYTVPLQELLSQFAVFFYVDALIQFMTIAVRGSQAGIGNPDTLGYALADLSREILAKAYYQVPSSYSIHAIWFPIAILISAFGLLLFALEWSKRHIDNTHISAHPQD